MLKQYTIPIKLNWIACTTGFRCFKLIVLHFLCFLKLVSYCQTRWDAFCKEIIDNKNKLIRLFHVLYFLMIVLFHQGNKCTSCDVHFAMDLWSNTSKCLKKDQRSLNDRHEKISSTSNMLKCQYIVNILTPFTAYALLAVIKAGLRGFQCFTAKINTLINYLYHWVTSYHIYTSFHSRVTYCKNWYLSKWI